MSPAAWQVSIAPAGARARLWPKGTGDHMDIQTAYPHLRPLGLDGLLISFGAAMSDAANRAAVAADSVAVGAGPNMG